jgi:hypothetical protein
MIKKGLNGLWVGIAALVISAQVAAQNANCVNACLATNCNASDYPAAAARNNCRAVQAAGCKSSCSTRVVPTLVGHMLSEVRGLLAGASLPLGQVTGLNDPNLYVIAQFPSAGADVPSFTAVAVTIETPPASRASSLIINSFTSIPFSIQASDITGTPNLLGDVAYLAGNGATAVIAIPNGRNYQFLAWCSQNFQNSCCPAGAVGCSINPRLCFQNDVIGPLCYLGTAPSRIWRGDSTAGPQSIDVNSW